MITQTIKQWLNTLFAWWPWKRSSTTRYVQVVDATTRGVTQEQMWRTTVDGPIPQPGNMSVAVEQGMDESIPDLSSDDRAGRITQYSPVTGITSSSLLPAEPIQPEKIGDVRDVPAPVATFERKIAFLQYLVRRGIVNEGFVDGREPEQYRRKEL